MLAVMAGWRSALSCVPMCVLSATGLVWSATRASVIGLAIELVVANAVRYTGARPVFVDCDPCNYNIDLALAEQRTAQVKGFDATFAGGIYVG